MRTMLIRFFERLWFDLGLKHAASRRFELDDAIYHSVLEIAQREGRSTGEVTAGLVGEALDQRKAAEENLRLWRELTSREREIAALTCLDYTNAEIARMLVISEETVKSHMLRVLRKFGLHRKEDLRVKLAQWDFRAWERGE